MARVVMQGIGPGVNGARSTVKTNVGGLKICIYYAYSSKFAYILVCTNNYKAYVTEKVVRGKQVGLFPGLGMGGGCQVTGTGIFVRNL